MRVALLFAAFSLASFSVGQIMTPTLEGEIRDAYTNFRTQSLIYTFELKGQEILGKTTVPLHAFLYWRLGYDARTGRQSRAEVELDVLAPTKDGGERYAMRIVGDGTNLYRYDLDRGEVATTTYGFYGPKVPPHYAESDAPKLLSQLRTATPGAAAYLVRLLTEINPSGPLFTQRFAEWLPGRAGRVFDMVPTPIRNARSTVAAAHFVTDPITGRLFYRGDSRAFKYVFYGMDRADTDRTVTFAMADARSDPDNPLWQVQSVSVAQRAAGRLLDLVLTPGTGTPPIWAFLPYTGTQAAAFRPVNAGGH